MDWLITAFHQDDVGDWVAELSCGHDQHVRHRPPFQERTWVTTELGRSRRIGQAIECPLCDRAEMPDCLRPTRSTPVWTEETLPAGLRRSHRLGPGTWARIRVRTGRLRFTMATDPPTELELVAGEEQAIPPELVHQVEPLGAVRLSLDFFAIERPTARPTPPAAEGGDPPCWSDRVCPTCGRMLDHAHGSSDGVSTHSREPGAGAPSG